MLPNYKDGSIVNLMSSIGSSLAWKSPYKPLKILPPAGLKTRNIVLIVIDAIGYGFLKEYAKNSFCSRHCIGSITSVFLSTTASAIPVFHSGLAPQQHALTGWKTYSPRLGTVILPLRFSTAIEDIPLDQLGVKPADLFIDHHFSDKITTKTSIVFHTNILRSGFNSFTYPNAKRYGYTTYEGFVRQVSKAIRKGRNYVFAYIDDCDRLGHKYGPYHPKTISGFKRIDNAIKAISKRLKGTNTTIIVTADHGMHPIKQTLYVEDLPGLRDNLLVPPCGEPRALICYVKANRKKQFKRFVSEKLGRYCTLHKSESLLSMGFFGLFKPNPIIKERIGDYILIMKDGYVIMDCLPCKKKKKGLGSHGGLSKEEMLVPLVVVNP